MIVFGGRETGPVCLIIFAPKRMGRTFDGTSLRDLTREQEYPRFLSASWRRSSNSLKGSFREGGHGQVKMAKDCVIYFNLHIN